MKKKVLLLSGWGQKHTSLSFLLNDLLDEFELYNIDYLSCRDVEEFYLKLKQFDFSFDFVIGWSLGGQLALRIIIEKIIKKPKNLILLAPVFAFIKTKQINAAMSKRAFETLKQQFSNSPQQFLIDFSELCAKTDENSNKIVENLNISANNYSNLFFWLNILAEFSFFDCNFSELENIPTTLFHGQNDMVIHVNQASYFAKKINHLDIRLIDNCGHLPQIKAIDQIQQILKNER